MKSFTINEINEILKGILIGTTTNCITGPEQLERAKNNHITFIGSKKYVQYWEGSNATAAIINEDIEVLPGENRALIRVKNADLAMAQLLELFAPKAPTFDCDIHASANVDSTAIIGTGCKIGAGVYIGKNVTIGDHTILYPNVTVLDDSTIGSHSVLWSGTVIRERCHIGSHCILQPNVTIGADGFGYHFCPDLKMLVKIPQIGNVIIGNGVEIGSGSCVDRGKFSATILGDGTKIDNLVQIGHNSVLGKCCIMAGNSGLAGSVTLGDGVVIGGSASIKDHVTIGDGAMVGAGSGVIADIPSGKKMLGYPAVESREALRQWAAIKRLTKQA
ncbi:UDP-3-O-(3-hydroxymyristoyl)glucosamine N-acyltransferase [Flavobacterium sp. '19STA2R22 D10 B1']|uniref:UDP-3-O-(3-hydroxymyristoyl)glucosamine N-acyltransferase n=1 Tax=Flavobacterium aerium TaxID=3037261 RepID=UPI00278C562C|nr:UDP-3-O-(3-hydroxymyristoyl)glucosamine N-acyltransferase [Flavobacterium sp. '19STA2R22 D10 B1']